MTTPRPSTALSAYPVLVLAGGFRPSSPLCPPALTEATFLSPATPDGQGRVAVARLSGRDLDPRELRCESNTPGHAIELLPMCTRQGDDLIVGLRITSEPGTLARRCSVRFVTGSTLADATVDFAS